MNLISFFRGVSAVCRWLLVSLFLCAGLQQACANSNPVDRENLYNKLLPIFNPDNSACRQSLYVLVEIDASGDFEGEREIVNDVWAELSETFFQPGDRFSRSSFAESVTSFSPPLKLTEENRNEIGGIIQVETSRNKGTKFSDSLANMNAEAARIRKQESEAVIVKLMITNRSSSDYTRDDPNNAHARDNFDTDHVTLSNKKDTIYLFFRKEAGSVSTQDVVRNRRKYTHAYFTPLDTAKSVSWLRRAAMAVALLIGLGLLTLPLLMIRWWWQQQTFQFWLEVPQDNASIHNSKPTFPSEPLRIGQKVAVVVTSAPETYEKDKIFLKVGGCKSTNDPALIISPFLKGLSLTPTWKIRKMPAASGLILTIYDQEVGTETDLEMRYRRSDETKDLTKAIMELGVKDESSIRLPFVYSFLPDRVKLGSRGTGELALNEFRLLMAASAVMGLILFSASFFSVVFPKPAPKVEITEPVCKAAK